MLVRMLTLTTAMLISWSASSEEITGLARAIDGGSLVVGRNYVRLCGVGDPKTGGVGFRRDSKVLADLVAEKTVRCIPLGEGTPCDGIARGGTFKRQIAQCFVGEKDLAAELIRSGEACAFVSESGTAYVALGCSSKAER